MLMYVCVTKTGSDRCLGNGEQRNARSCMRNARTIEKDVQMFLCPSGLDTQD